MSPNSLMRAGSRTFISSSSDAVPLEQRLAPALRGRFHGSLILAEGYTRESATAAIAEDRADFVAFGALFIANPDLVERFRRGAALIDRPDDIL